MMMIYSPVKLHNILTDVSSDQVSPKKLANPAGGKSSIAGGPSRFGRFGSQLLQKTMGWVSRSRQDRQVVSFLTCFCYRLL